jgi:hypothetical protein
VLIGKQCLNPDCGKTIAVSAATCPHCGTSQLPEFTEPWGCSVCGTINDSTAETCVECGKPRGTPAPASRDALLEQADRDDKLSIPGCSVPLADGQYSNPIDVDVYASRGPLVPAWQAAAVPSIVLKTDKIEIFLDKGHTLFKSYRVRPEEVVANEVAQFLYDANRRLVERFSATHTLANLTWQILERYWSDDLADSPEQVSADVTSLFSAIRERLPLLAGDRSEELFTELTEQQKRRLVENMLGQGDDISKLGAMKTSGDFLRLVDEDAIVSVFRAHPEMFFDGGVWDVAYASIEDLEPAIIEEVQGRFRAIYLNCLEDCAAFLHYRSPELLVTFRARASVDFLSQKLV